MIKGVGREYLQSPLTSTSTGLSLAHFRYWFSTLQRSESKIITIMNGFTLTPCSIGSLLIISINGGLPRGVPVVRVSPSTEFPYTLAASHRLGRPWDEGTQSNFSSG